MSKLPTVEFYEDRSYSHRWNLKHGNGKVLAASSEGFKSKGNAKRNFRAVRDAMAKIVLMATTLFALTVGCARFSSHQLRTDKDGSTVESRQTVTTLFDAKSEIAKLRASTTDKSQGLTLGSLNEETSGTNSVAVIHAVVDAAVTAAAKSVKP